jgi:hypothetical protein
MVMASVICRVLQQEKTKQVSHCSAPAGLDWASSFNGTLGRTHAQGGCKIELRHCGDRDCENHVLVAVLAII